MVSAANLNGKILKGMKTGTTWEIVGVISTTALRKVSPERSHTYRVRNTASGQYAFLKAADADIVEDDDETLAVRLEALLMHHKFEAQVSEHCQGNNMDRVCLAIDHGNMMIEHNGTREPVFYLVFELADGDIRNQVFSSEEWPIERKFQLLHHVAVGLSQLHGVKVSHNDIKPPNILAYGSEHKIADLGQATKEDQTAPHDWEAVIGDPRYAPPETLYMQDGLPGTRLVPNRLRQSGDMYLLGSLAYFLFSGRMMTPVILDGLLQIHLPPCQASGWQGTFSDVIPFWRAAFSEEMASFRMDLSTGSSLKPESVEKLLVIIHQLCDPDPERRGHPLDQANGQRTFNLQRYVTAFDVLSRKLH